MIHLGYQQLDRRTGVLSSLPDITKWNLILDKMNAIRCRVILLVASEAELLMYCAYVIRSSLRNKHLWVRIEWQLELLCQPRY